ncbi:hypothetical protein [Photobacterium aquimaris]|nr:hypothetical protein [Photobacterium aquimaris]OBU14714.1 hypothetical protein AYY21_06885 [Photobacterium aquimaris]PQJ41124.1 hypothetical protein BTN98_05630 [Photobacterium aquimaris]
MSDHIKEVRKVIGKIGIGKESFNNNETSLGFIELGLEWFYEDDQNLDIQDINRKEYFCNTRKVFIYKGFNDLKSKFNNNELVLIEASKSKDDVSLDSNKQEFVSEPRNVTKLPSTFIFDVIDVDSNFIDNNFAIQLDRTPSTEFIILNSTKDGMKLSYGPLAWTVLDQENSIYKVSVPSRSPISNKTFRDQYSYQIETMYIDNYFVKTIIDNIEYKYLINNKEYSNAIGKFGESFDVMDNEKIIKDFAPILFNYKPFQKLTAKSIETLKNNERMARSANSKINVKRLNRVVKILENIQSWGDNREEILQELVLLPTVEKTIQEYIKNNESEYFEKYKNNELKSIVDEIKKEEDKFSQRVESLKQMIQGKALEVQSLDDDIKKKEKELDEMERIRTEEIQEQAMANAKAEEKELANRIIEKQKTLDSLQTEYSNLKNVDDLNNRRNALKLIISDLETEELDLKSGIKDLETKLENKGKILSDYISNLSIYKNESNLKCNEIENEHFTFKNVEFDEFNGSLIEARQKLINKIGFSLSKYGRNYSYEAIVNFVVTISQNQFTIFAGLPGGGKTSMAKLLGKSMNLGNRQHTIPVSRNWTSTKDILGYYNGLSGQYQNAPTGLWHLLNTIQNDKLSEVNPVLLLLDEMNLSQPEYYFSPFLDLSDEESERKIITDHPNASDLTIPEHIKFIGTVNCDDTVQPLSPRMIDRSAVISFDSLSSESFNSFEDENNSKCTIRAQDFIDLFKPTEIKVDVVTIQELNKIIAIIEDVNPELGQRHIISYRKRKQILNYIEVAGSMLLELDENIALDHAVSQYVLPMINGFGIGYNRRLLLLIEKLRQLNCNQSESILNSIIVSGEHNLNSYRFAI